MQYIATCTHCIHYWNILQLALYIHIYILYEHEAILKPKTEKNVGAPMATQELYTIPT